MSAQVEGPAPGAARGAAAKQRILDAAAEAFMRRGFDATTIDDIADQLGATKGLVYYHFRSKFDLFLAVYAEAMRRVRGRVEPHAGTGGAGRERLTAMSVAHLLNLMTDLAYHHTVHQGVRAQDSADLRVRQRDALIALNELRQDYEDMFRRVIDAGVADGSLRAVDPRLAARVLLSSLNGVDLWYRRIDGQPLAELEALAQAVAGLMIDGLARSPA
ncbi:TetR family transcriptional regulator [Nocardioides sp. GXQ0305]|uniref:TetR family transcriptional regulator n=1 Tax=Nocardioides sp. GXQ0305 TaxID=3423912 RepID=UPI003D7C71AA